MGMNLRAYSMSIRPARAPALNFHACHGLGSRGLSYVATCLFAVCHALTPVAANRSESSNHLPHRAYVGRCRLAPQRATFYLTAAVVQSTCEGLRGARSGGYRRPSQEGKPCQ